MQAITNIFPQDMWNQVEFIACRQTLGLALKIHMNYVKFCFVKSFLMFQPVDKQGVLSEGMAKRLMLVSQIYHQTDLPVLPTL